MQTSFAKNLLFFILSTLAGVLMMWWLYRGFRVEYLFDFFTQRSHFLWILLALASGVVANVLRSMRWHMLLQSAGISVSLRKAVELVFIAYLVNSVTPRLGELTRALLLKRGNADISTKALGTVVVEKLADVGCLILLVGLAVTVRWQSTKELVHRVGEGLQWALPSYSVYIMAGCAVCVLVGLSLPLLRHLRRFFRNLWTGICAIAHLRRPDAFAALCLGIWTCNFLQLYLLAPCFVELADMDMGSLLHVFAAASVGVLLPTPAGAGPWHFAIVKTLTAAYAVPKTVAQSFALVSHGLKTALVMLLGILGYASYYRSLFRWVRKSVGHEGNGSDDNNKTKQ